MRDSKGKTDESVRIDDFGDNEARPDEMGSGNAQATADPTAFGATSSVSHATGARFDPSADSDDAEGMETMLASDGRLGLTNVGDAPADDWAADSGPTRTAEEADNH